MAGYTRLDILSFADPWDPVVDWYERAVAELLTRRIDNPLSWRYLAAMHGISREGWTANGYLSAGQVLPKLQDTVWNQCQHQSWYFLPWHRGYLASFEAIIRATVVQLGGPKDWALPYWNYNSSRTNALELPAAFRSRTKNDGSPNHLWIAARYGSEGNGTVKLDPDLIRLECLLESAFSDVTGGFGGPATAFNPGGGHENGRLESEPHNNVHGLVGGALARQPRWDQIGLMSTPVLAALDPIFWLHHCNIDRLWEVWQSRSPANRNPSVLTWLNGPPAGGRDFVYPDAAGALHVRRVADVVSAAALGYEYDDISDPLQGRPILPAAPAPGLLTMPPQPREFGANREGPVNLGRQNGEVSVQIDPAAQPNLLAPMLLTGGEPRVFLSLEGVTCPYDAPIVKVYLRAADKPEAPEKLVGSISMFGVAQASDPSDPIHGGGGLTQSIEITDAYRELAAQGALDANQLTVKFREATSATDLADISVGKVRLVRKN